jgi:hypothetical protein
LLVRCALQGFEAALVRAGVVSVAAAAAHNQALLVDGVLKAQVGLSQLQSAKLRAAVLAATETPSQAAARRGELRKTAARSASPAAPAAPGSGSSSSSGSCSVSSAAGVTGSAVAVRASLSEETKAEPRPPGQVAPKRQPSASELLIAAAASGEGEEIRSPRRKLSLAATRNGELSPIEKLKLAAQKLNDTKKMVRYWH